MAMDRMLAGRSTRRHQIGLEPVGQQVTEVATATSRSAVSRKFVTQTQTALAELLSADLSRRYWGSPMRMPWRRCSGRPGAG